MRLALIAVVALAIGAAGSASAQSCHPPAPQEPRELGLRVGLAFEVAAYRTSRFEGDYQGLALNVGWVHRWVRLRAGLPAYRLVRNGAEEYGIGDVWLDVRVPIARAANDTVVGGIGLAATAPTGDASRDLGMGHFMLMPTLWATWRSEQAFIQAQVAYGRALSSDGGAHHGAGGPRPIVNPMNASEVEMAGTGGLILDERIRIRGGAYGAVPVATDDGAPRAVAFAGADLILDWFDMALEGHLPLAGDPFLAKIVLAVGARF